ncbi:hypothetical protein T492DRAFT_861460 [Pavlovales sp. CCMP2436]|nr:hypothetical protein T492DRAFT_861460 [Pavlovales sp. CCMP2436]
MEDGSFGDGGGDGEDELPGEDPVPAPPSKPTRITPCMIAESAGIVSADGARLPADDVATQVVKLTRLRLDRRNIADMDGLECCEGATHVFLQHNRIDKIDGVMFLKALQFLSLAEGSS